MSSVNASTRHLVTPPFLCRAFAKSAFRSLMPLGFFADSPLGNLMTLTLTNPGREFSSRFPVFDVNIPFSRPVTLSRPTTSR